MKKLIKLNKILLHILSLYSKPDPDPGNVLNTDQHPAPDQGYDMKIEQIVTVIVLIKKFKILLSKPF